MLNQSLDLFGGALPQRKAIGGHERNSGGSDEWLTPPWLITSLGEFDLDPASPIYRPWPTARQHMTLEDDGLRTPWPEDARVWCNPPYAHVWKWLAKLADHGNGIALIFARTETKGFREQVWEKADGMLFLHKRLSFHRVDGTEAKANSGAPSVLAASGQTGRVMVKLPAEVSEWYAAAESDWWHGDEECIGCRQVECRQALYTGHGVQFDEDGKQYLPGGPRMAEHGVCMLMSFVAMRADIAQKLADEDPRCADWRRQCHKHEHPTKRKKCPQSHFAAEAEYRARLATKVWGSEVWRERAWA